MSAFSFFLIASKWTDAGALLISGEHTNHNLAPASDVPVCMMLFILYFKEAWLGTAGQVRTGFLSYVTRGAGLCFEH